MSSDKKAKYRSLISRLQGIANSIDSSIESVNNIQPELNKGILINDAAIEEDVFFSTDDKLNDAKNYLYNAIRSCYNSMNKEEDE